MSSFLPTSPSATPGAVLARVHFHVHRINSKPIDGILSPAAAAAANTTSAQGFLSAGDTPADRGTFGAVFLSHAFFPGCGWSLLAAPPTSMQHQMEGEKVLLIRHDETGAYLGVAPSTTGVSGKKKSPRWPSSAISEEDDRDDPRSSDGGGDDYDDDGSAQRGWSVGVGVGGGGQDRQLQVVTTAYPGDMNRWKLASAPGYEGSRVGPFLLQSLALADLSAPPATSASPSAASPAASSSSGLYLSSHPSRDSLHCQSSARDALRFDVTSRALVGWLKKRTGTTRTTRDRFFLLMNRKLMYFDHGEFDPYKGETTPQATRLHQKRESVDVSSASFHRQESFSSSFGSILTPQGQQHQLATPVSPRSTALLSATGGTIPFHQAKRVYDLGRLKSVNTFDYAGTMALTLKFQAAKLPPFDAQPDLEIKVAPQLQAKPHLVTQGRVWKEALEREWKGRGVDGLEDFLPDDATTTSPDAAAVKEDGEDATNTSVESLPMQYKYFSPTSSSAGGHPGHHHSSKPSMTLDLLLSSSDMPEAALHDVAAAPTADHDLDLNIPPAVLYKFTAAAVAAAAAAEAEAAATKEAEQRRHAAVAAEEREAKATANSLDEDVMWVADDASEQAYRQAQQQQQQPQQPQQVQPPSASDDQTQVPAEKEIYDVTPDSSIIRAPSIMPNDQSRMMQPGGVATSPGGFGERSVLPIEYSRNAYDDHHDDGDNGDDHVSAFGGGVRASPISRRWGGATVAAAAAASGASGDQPAHVKRDSASSMLAKGNLASLFAERQAAGAGGAGLASSSSTASAAASGSLAAPLHDDADASAAASQLWKQATDAKSGRPYWYHRVTKQTTWYPPAAVLAGGATTTPAAGLASPMAASPSSSSAVGATASGASSAASPTGVVSNPLSDLQRENAALQLQLQRLTLQLERAGIKTESTASSALTRLSGIGATLLKGGLGSPTQPQPQQQQQQSQLQQSHSLSPPKPFLSGLELALLSCLSTSPADLLVRESLTLRLQYLKQDVAAVEVGLKTLNDTATPIASSSAADADASSLADSSSSSSTVLLVDDSIQRADSAALLVHLHDAVLRSVQHFAAELDKLPRNRHDVIRAKDSCQILIATLTPTLSAADSVAASTVAGSPSSSTSGSHPTSEQLLVLLHKLLLLMREDFPLAAQAPPVRLLTASLPTERLPGYIPLSTVFLDGRPWCTLEVDHATGVATQRGWNEAERQQILAQYMEGHTPLDEEEEEEEEEAAAADGSDAKSAPSPAGPPVAIYFNFSGVGSQHTTMALDAAQLRALFAPPSDVVVVGGDGDGRRGRYAYLKPRGHFLVQKLQPIALPPCDGNSKLFASLAPSLARSLKQIEASFSSEKSAHEQLAVKQLQIEALLHHVIQLEAGERVTHTMTPSSATGSTRPNFAATPATTTAAAVASSPSLPLAPSSSSSAREEAGVAALPASLATPTRPSALMASPASASSTSAASSERAPALDSEEEEDDDRGRSESTSDTARQIAWIGHGQPGEHEEE